MKEIFNQLITIWRDLKPLQKLSSFAILIAVTAFFSFLIFKSSTESLPEVKPTENVTHTLCEVKDAVKGFELFDTNTWIKGEKELQVLEMRAIKGQLEKDLATFEHIKSASVILDLPPPKGLNGPKYPTKASVILTLMPNTHLSSSELKAINNHLTGAVRGLEPNMIAISDTTGKLYKSIDPYQEETLQENSAFFEEQLEAKVAELLKHLVGLENFYATVQTVLDQKTRAIQKVSITAVINKTIFTDSVCTFQEEIKRQLMALAKGYGFEVEPIVDFIPFGKPQTVTTPKAKYTAGFFFTLFFVIAALAALFPLLKRNKRGKEDEEEPLLRMMTQIDLNKLGSSMQQEDPQTIALMLSYLEPARAEQFIATLNVDLQHKVLFHLSELEKG